GPVAVAPKIVDEKPATPVASPPPAPRASKPDEPRPAATPKSGDANREQSRRRRAEKQKARNRVGKLESEIAEFESRLEELTGELARDPDGDWERLNTLANEEQELRARLERRYAEWERVSKVLEAED
ncbi:MAG: hypothetical protein KC591_07360, partial [Gemmatimonadetes bacterium]|nr:hypothetical protein [Gemmatimonadota bacterium]